MGLATSRRLMATMGALALVVGCGSAPAPGPAPAAGPCDGTHWVASWGAAQTDAAIGIDATFTPMPLLYHEQTIRNVITPHLGGSRVRLHLTNRYNPSPVTYAHVTVGLGRPDGGVTEPTSVLFGGKRSVTVGAGQDVVSDPVDLSFAAFDQLAVSIHVPWAFGQVTKHWNSNATTYISPAGSGDVASSPSGEPFTIGVESWLGILALDVEAPASTRAIVALGDSLTDGWVGSTQWSELDRSVSNTDQRYPDFLQRRITDAGLPISMINAGLGSNQVLSSIVPFAGPSAIDRFDADVAYFATARGVIIFEGINDLGLSHASAASIIAGYEALVAKARAADLKVWLATLTPASDAAIHGVALAPNSERDRQTINTWIRTQTIADGYFDFDAAVRDPSDPTVLDPRYSSVDRLHLDPAGYERVAAAVDLATLASTTC
jgi:lysophospholipase L1-like esterase